MVSRKKQSAGLLLYRKNKKTIEVLLVHPGGPFWAKKDLGAWSIPKGEFEEGEEAADAARREFQEELGLPAPVGAAIGLGSAKQPSGKVVYAWAIEADLDVSQTKSTSFEMEWPPKSGKKQIFPEVDKAAWFGLAAAKRKLVKGQVPLLETLAETLGIDIAATDPSSGESESNPQTSLF